MKELFLTIIILLHAMIMALIINSHIGHTTDKIIDEIQSEKCNCSEQVTK